MTSKPAVTMRHQPHIATIQKLLEQISQIDLKAAVPEEIWEKHELGGFLQQIRKLCSALSQFEWQFVPKNVVNTIQAALHEFVEKSKGITGNSYRLLSAPDKDRYVAEFISAWDKVYATCGPHLNPLNVGITSRTEALNDLKDEFKGEIESIQTQKKQLENDLEEIQKTAKRSEEVRGQLEKELREGGIAAEARHFNDEAKWASRVSYGWAIIAVFFIGATIHVAVSVLLPAEGLPMMTLPEVVAFIIPKAIIISVLYFGLAWSAGHYSAARHNVVVNRHRANALTTFRTFTQGTSDPQVINAILLQATTAVFRPQTSGYLKRESEQPEAPPMIQVLQDLSKRDKPS